MDDEFVDAYVIATGKKRRIPRHWLDHPTLGAPFRLTPKAAAKQRRTAADQGESSSSAAPTDTDASTAPDLDSSTDPSNTDTAAEPKE